MPKKRAVIAKTRWWRHLEIEKKKQSGYGRGATNHDSGAMASTHDCIGDNTTAS